MSDFPTYIHYALTAITAITVGILQYRAVMKAKETDKEIVCQEDINQIKTDIAVLKTRVDNETHLLERLDDKLNRLLERT